MIPRLKKLSKRIINIPELDQKTNILTNMQNKFAFKQMLMTFAYLSKPSNTIRTGKGIYYLHSKEVVQEAPELNFLQTGQFHVDI